MKLQFKLLDSDNIKQMIPLMQQFTENKYSNALLEERFQEMFTQNYECAGIFDGDLLVGISGMWFCTRHYSGKSVEVDHVFIDPI